MRLFPVINLFLNETQTSGNYVFKETDLDSLHKHLQHTGALVWVEGVRLFIREFRWQMRSLGESVTEGLQTVDLLCFSAQFYCTTAMIRRSDVRLDSVITWIAFRRLCLKMADILKIWMRKSLENQRRNWSRSSWRP